MEDQYSPVQLRNTWTILFLITLQFSSYGQEGIYFQLEKDIDSIIQVGLDSLAYPGAQVLVWHRDTIAFHKTYGHHTYENRDTVRKDDFYDLASITKVAGGIPAIIKLYDEGLLDLDASLGSYLKEFRRSNKGDITIREILAHQSGMIPYIVFWQKGLKKNGRFKKRIFRKKPSKRFGIKITDDLYMRTKYRNKMRKAICKSEVSEDKEYLYSGLFFQIIPDFVKELTNRNFAEYLYSEIYQPLHLDGLMYEPLSRISAERIIPTENDTFFRNLTVHGTVHDEAAAMMGGVSGNAGLFGNAEGLLRLFQYYIEPWSTNGSFVLTPSSIKEFTSYQYEENENHRGLGFDKPRLTDDDENSYIATSANPESFGHSGFTGTFVWADPVDKIIVIFLSNRVHPSRSNRKLYTMNIRRDIHEAAYDVLVGK